MQLPLLVIESLIYAHNISTGGSDVVRQLLRDESSVLGASLSDRDTAFSGLLPCMLGGTMAGNAEVPYHLLVCACKPCVCSCF